MNDGLYFLFGVHDHQPVGNFDAVLREAAVRAYHPFLETLRDAAPLPLTVHCSGGLLDWWREHARPTFDLLGALVADGRVELLTGGFYEPILPMLPDWDKVGQIQALTEFIVANFGARPRGMWVAERVWEPHLPQALREAGVEFIVLDDAHFGLAGLDPETLGGYYLTEEQGATLAVFPINQRLRYLVPFAEPAESIVYLEQHRGAGCITLMDDGEKFGAWPSTDRLVYGERWLARFFESLARVPGLTVSTFSRYLDAVPARGRVYLPAASYREMGEWALDAQAWEELQEAKERLRGLADGERLGRLLRGGTWRNFLTKYPEMAEAYWKMLRLSRDLRHELRARPGDWRLLESRQHLWRGQANDAYWHGVFGGCYLPHLRRAVKSALIAAERTLGQSSDSGGIRWEQADHDGDGLAEVRVRTDTLSLTLRPAAGGTLTELAWFARDLDVADVLARRREGYHSRLKEHDAASARSVRTVSDAATSKEPDLWTLLQYDVFRRASLLDGLFPLDAPPDPLEPWGTARLALGDRPMPCAIRESDEALEITLSHTNPDGLPLEVRKVATVSRDGADLAVRYRVEWNGAVPLAARWGVQFNLALTAGDAPGRYYRLPGQPSLGSRGAAFDQRGLAMVDEWLGCEVGIHWGIPAEVGWAPVQTVSLSEDGFERIYQGSAILLMWPLRLVEREIWEVSLRLSLRELPRRELFP